METLMRMTYPGHLLFRLSSLSVVNRKWSPGGHLVRYSLRCCFAIENGHTRRFGRTETSIKPHGAVGIDRGQLLFSRILPILRAASGCEPGNSVAL